MVGCADFSPFQGKAQSSVQKNQKTQQLTLTIKPFSHAAIVSSSIEFYKKNTSVI
jgi:hypothetical protein